jgi:hypothetical protein
VGTTPGFICFQNVSSMCVLCQLPIENNTEVFKSPSKKNQVLDYFLQYMYSRKLQKYDSTVIVSQITTKRLLRCIALQSTT